MTGRAARWYRSLTGRPEEDGGTGFPAGTWRTVLRFAAFITPYKLPFILSGLMMAAGSVLSLVQPVVYRHLVDDVLNAPAGQSPYGLLALYVGLLAAIRLGMQLAGVYRTIWKSRVSYAASRDLESEVYRTLDRLPMAVHDRHTSGDLLPRLFSDPSTVVDSLVNLIPSLLESLVRGIIVFVIVLNILWWAGLAALIPVIPIAVLAVWNIRYFKHLSHRLFQRQQALISQILGFLSGIRLIRVFNRSQAESARFRRLQDDVFHIRMENVIRSAWISPLITTLGKTGGILIFIVAAVKLLSRTGTAPGEFSLGVLFMLLGYVWQLADPITQMGHMAGSYGHVQAAAVRLEEIFSEPERPCGEPAATSSIQPGAALTLEDVVFEYEPGEPVLHGISFAIQPGEVVGLIGPSGSGKTTISNLICGFYPASRGSLTVPRAVSLAMQSPQLMHRTIRENVTFGTGTVSGPEIDAVLDVVEAAEFVRGLPQGLDTMVGDGGRTLSSGQQQRLALARAILAPAPLLILDEATSWIDLWTEQRIWKNIRAHCRDRSILCISHRIHLMKHTDRILVLVNGRIVEQGGHQQLSGQDGYYAACLEMRDFDGSGLETV